ncbi:uracil-DNA glycosylase [Candidatus Bathyarchaeota archaeon]|nr:MAG: uracil-DNA glycosylase [Candidatus Bathyarchaeota archaeon]
MIVSDYVVCRGFPCLDVEKTQYIVPQIDIDPDNIQIVLISESSPQNLSDYYYMGNESLFTKTTLQAFNEAGIQAETLEELVQRGIYFTTAIKYGKTGYLVKAATIKNCSQLLEKELAFFPNVKVIMLMGDFAIKALNYIAKRQLGENVIPSGSTYKIRGKEYYYGEIRVFPSYLQAGQAYFIEQSKRRIIKEDLQDELKILEFI